MTLYKDFADDLALILSTQRHMQLKTNSNEAITGNGQVLEDGSLTSGPQYVSKEEERMTLGPG